MGEDDAELDAGMRRGRRRALGMASYASGSLLVFATGAFAVLGLVGGINALVYAGVLVVLLLAALGLLVAAERFFVPSVRDALARDPRPPVVYLRPFDEDSERVYDVISSGETTSVISAKAEDFLMPLNAIGPLVSIAEPNLAARIGMHTHGA